MAWNAASPNATASGVSASVDGPTSVIRSNWIAIEQWEEREHYGVVSGGSLSGRHKPGVIGVMSVATNPTTSTTAESGALWLDTDANSGGSISVFSSGGWYNIAKQQFKVRVSSDTDLTLDAATTNTLTFGKVGTFDFDPLSAFNSSTNVITLPESGYYMVRASVSLKHVARDSYKNIKIILNDSVTPCAYTGKYGYYQPYLWVEDIMKLQAADYLQIKMYNGDSVVLTAQVRDWEVYRL